MDLPANNPRLAWNIQLYERGELDMPAHLEVHDLTLVLEGTVTGVRNISVGKGGKVYLRQVLCRYTIPKLL